jgi:cytochrome b
LIGPKVRIWDLPTRLFHWAIVILIPALWWTHEIGRLDLHILLGEVMLGLILFRLIWGVIGSSTARFAGFLRGPGTVFRYVRGRAAGMLGHNPIGGWSVFVMLLLLAVETGLGLFVTDEDGLNSGSLSHLSTMTAHGLSPTAMRPSSTYCSASSRSMSPRFSIICWSSATI